MPIYAYLCADCGNDFEELVLGGETPRCPSCESERLEKQVSAFAPITRSAPAPMPPGACGTCGDPRGPGACAS